MSDKLYCDCDDDTCNCAGCPVAGADDEPVEPVQCWDDKPAEMDLSDVGPHSWIMLDTEASPKTAAAMIRKARDAKWVAQLIAALGGES